jgi:hypothetical protein
MRCGRGYIAKIAKEKNRTEEIARNNPDAGDVWLLGRG